MVAKVLAVFNQKGGCGKSTISMQIAGAMALRGVQTLVVDMDPQGTSTQWAGAAPDTHPFPAHVMSLAPLKGKMHQQVKNYIDSYDLIVIDCPPAMESDAPKSAMLIADLALIPVVPSPPDIWAAKDAKKLAIGTQVTNEALQVRVVANMVQKATSMARDIMEVLKDDEEVPMLKSVLGSRTAYRDCQLMGGVVHVVPRAAAAIAEVEALTDEVSGLLGLKAPPAEAKRGGR